MNALFSILAGARARRIAASLCALPIAACDDPVGPHIDPGEHMAVVVNSVERSLTVIPIDDPASAFTIGLAPDGSPVSLGIRGGIVVVPMGVLPSAVVVNVADRAVVRTVPLPEGSGATGAAFLNDSIALVANPALNSVSPINVLSGTVGTPISVGTYPQAILAANDTAFVINAQLDGSFQPTGPGTISVMAGDPLAIVRTIVLGGLNPGAAAFGDDGHIYVVHAGHFGNGDGSLSAIDRRTLVEVAHDGGFGEFPGALAVAPDGRIAVSAFAYGIALWDPRTRTFARSPQDAATQGGVASVSGIAYDGAGRLYALQPECLTQGSVLRLDAALALELEIPAGICPLAIGIASVPTLDP